MDLFDSGALKHAPLAERMRPRALDKYVGQEHLVGEGKLLRQAILEDKLPSMIFWGPPGVGKTALAAVIASSTASYFERLSAVTSGVADIKRVVAEATDRLKLESRRTVLFIDEVHRWNKSQQDALLPHVEKGTVILIGATTENPSFEVNSALLSRSRVFTLERLTHDELKRIIGAALSDAERGLGSQEIELEPEAEEFLLASSNGDARLALNTLEAAAALAGKQRKLSLKLIEEALQHKALLYDKAAEEHYNVISAFIKSMRGGSVDGALYWLHRMLEAGEDPKYVARRLVVFASEDVGLADPHALPMANAAFYAVTVIGLPEASINLSHAAAYLARAPKSRSAYEAGGAARRAVREHLNLPVPKQLRNAPTKLMKDLGYGQGYTWDVRSEQFEAVKGYLPDELAQQRFYDEWETDKPEELQS
jgi:putative ATPase